MLNEGKYIQNSLIESANLAKLKLKGVAESFIDPSCKCSILRQTKARNSKAKRRRHAKEDIGAHKCSNLALNKKQDGPLRICIDPHKLNSSLKKCPPQNTYNRRAESEIRKCKSIE